VQAPTSQVNHSAALVGVFAALCCAAPLAHEQAEAAHAALPEIVLDKPAQHRDGIRTLPAVLAPELLRLPARVVADPRRDLRIAAPQDGVVEPAGASLPLAGQQVKAGQVLAWLRPAMSQPDRRDLETDLAYADRDIRLGHIQISRYNINEAEHLDIKLPTPSLEIVTNYHGAQARRGQLQGALHEPLPLLSPRAGTILRSPAVAGRVALTGQALFELNAPGALAVEAEYADDDIDADAVQRAITLDGHALSLRFLEESYDSGLRTHRALYAIADPDAGVFVNQPLSLAAPREQDAKATVVLPASAVFTHDGQSWVWLHGDAQRFLAQRVEVASSDGAVTRIVAGLRGGERVVTDGVAALNAIAVHAEAQPP